MATVQRSFFSWTGPGGSYFPPGGVHNWWMTGFKYGDAMSVTAHPVIGDPAALYRILQIDNVRIEGRPTGLTLLFQVRNIGSYAIPGYGVGVGWISS